MEKRSIPNQPVSWQHPFVNVFKKFNVFESSTQAKKGSVTEGQDNNIGRRVVRLAGSVSASNYVNIPDPVQGVASLALTGRYVYLEFLVSGGKFFNIHLDLNINGRDQVIRMTISNMFEQYKVVGGTNLQIPYPSNAPLKWTVMVLDLQYHLENFGLFQHSDITDFSNLHSLRSIQICSTLSIRGIFTSDTCYTIQSLPKDMDFKPPKDRLWSGTYQIVYYPSEIDPELKQQDKVPEPTSQTAAEEKENQPENNNNITNNEASVDAAGALANAEYAMRQSTKSFKSNKSQVSSKQQPQQQSQQQQQQQSVFEQSQQFPPSQGQSQSQFRPGPYTGQNSSQRNFHAENLVRHSQVSRKPESQEGLKPKPIAKLTHSIGFSGNSCPDIKWSKSLERPDELIYASGSLVISSEVTTNTQRFFQGHTAPITCLDVSRDGEWIVSGQDGKQAIIIIWDFLTGDCVKAFPCPHSNTKCVSFSHNKKNLATVGLDDKQREVITIWDLQSLETKRKPEIITQQISDFNVLCLKYSPIDSDQLVSCGRENIRFWRVKNEYLRGTPVVLNHQARNTVFTVLDFEFAFEEPSAALQSRSIKRVFVGSKQGMIFQINYTTKEKLNVYYCHDGPITSLSLSAGFCVTGSEDLHMRVWPLDLSESLIEAKHEGVLISLDVSADALRVACGTSNGSLGVLDISNNKYETLLRSHTQEITQMQVHPFCNYLITLSTDFTIRLWDIEKHEQVYEFPYPEEDQCTTISCSNTSMLFAAGYSTGIFRVFDIEKTDFIFEGRYHEKAISHIEYSPDDKHLIVADENSFYCLYDVTRNYQPVKTFEREIASQYQFSAFSFDSELLAYVGDSGTHINIIDTYTIGSILKIFSANTSFRKLVWSTNNTELFAITDDSRVKVFGIERTDPQHNEAYLLREISCTHRNGLTDIALSSNFKYMATVGGDNLLKVWDYEFALTGPGSSQVFLSHASKINCVCFSPDGTKLLTAGGFEGIYEWAFLGDLSKHERTVDFSEYIPVNMKKLPLSNSTYQANPVNRPSKASEQQALVFEENLNGGDYHNEGGDDDDDEEDAQIEQALNVHNFGEAPFRIDRVVQDINDLHSQQNNGVQIIGGSHQQQQHGHHHNHHQGPLFEIENSEQSHPARNQRGGQKSAHPVADEDDNSDGENEDVGPLANLMAQQKNLTGLFSHKKGNSIASATSNAPRFAPVKVEPVKAEELVFQKQKKKREKRTNPFRYVSNQIRKDNDLPFRHYYVPNLKSEVIEEKNLKLRENKEEFATDYVISFNNEAHDNVVWNYMTGWFAYSSQNMIIVETLSKNRKQKIINLPDFVSCLNLSRDFKFLVVGSASFNEKEISNIYVIDCKTFEVVKTLQFHTRGVQSIVFSSNRKYIVSIGNFKECTIAVWEWPSGKLLASSYTLDRINDVKISEIVHTADNQLEFCTVGRDTVQFWALDKANSLKYFDVFVPKQEMQREKKPDESNPSTHEMKAPEVIAVDYIVFGSKQYAVAGLSTGEIIVVDNEEFEIVYRNQVSLNGQQILDVKVSNSVHRVIITAMDEHIHYWDFERQLMENSPFTRDDFMITWARLKLASAVTSFFLDPTFKEGLVGLYNGGIYYVNLDNKYRTVLTGTIDNKFSYETHLVNDRLLITTHGDGRMKLWNVQTGEEVMEYKFVSVVKSVLFESKTSKIICFFENNNDVKIINSQKFFQAETFVMDEIRPSEKTSSEYAVKSFEAIIGGRSSKFIIMKSGNIFTMEQLIKEKRPILRFQKIFHVPNLVDFVALQEKSLFFSADSKGKVQVHQVDYSSDRQVGYAFTLIDECDFLDNPHGSLIDVSAEQKNLTKILYSETVSQTRISVSRLKDNTYYAINSNLQYIFVRNYQKRQILSRINLHSFPASLALIESKNNFKILIGLQDGRLEKVNLEEKDERELYTSVLEGAINSVYALQSNNQQTNVLNTKIVTSCKDGIAIYSI